MSSKKSGVEYHLFGFTGKEFDWEVKGWMNQYDYGFRIYDPRIGRFLSEDPITRNYPELTPNQFSSNRPIEGIDQDGLEFRRPTFGTSGWARSPIVRGAKDGIASSK